MTRLRRIALTTLATTAVLVPFWPRESSSRGWVALTNEESRLLFDRNNDHSSLELLQHAAYKKQIASGHVPNYPEKFSFRGVDVVFFSCIVIGLTVSSLLSASEQGYVHTSSAVLLPIPFFATFHYSYAIPQSYDLCVMLGKDAAFSGRLIGLYFLGSAFATFFIWLFLRSWPSMVLRMKNVMLIGLVLGLEGELIYFVATARISHGHSSNLLSLWMQLARFLSGVPAGVFVGMLYPFCAQCIPASQHAAFVKRIPIAMALGTGTGLTVMSALRMVGPKQGPAFPSLLMFVALLILLYWFFISFPSIEKTQLTPLRENVHFDNTTLAKRRIILLSCCVLMSLKVLIVSSLEVSSTLLLETWLKLDTAQIGMSVGIVFLLTVSQTFFHHCLHPRARLSWIRTLSLVALGGCVLLYHVRRPSELLMIDFFIVFTMSLAEALLQWVVVENLLPVGWIFADPSHASYYFGVVTFFARFAGPWMARALIQSGGLGKFAWVMLFAIVLFIFIFEVFVASELKEKDDSDSPPATSSSA